MALDETIKQYINDETERVYQGHSQPLFQLVSENTNNIREIRASIQKIEQANEKIYQAVKFFETAGEVTVSTGKIAGSLAVIVGVFWAFIKFIIFNSK